MGSSLNGLVVSVGGGGINDLGAHKRKLGAHFWGLAERKYGLAAPLLNVGAHK